MPSVIKCPPKDWLFKNSAHFHAKELFHLKWCVEPRMGGSRLRIYTRRWRRLAFQFFIINLVQAANKLLFLESAIIHFQARWVDFIRIRIWRMRHKFQLQCVDVTLQRDPIGFARMRFQSIYRFNLYLITGAIGRKMPLQLCHHVSCTDFSNDANQLTLEERNLYCLIAEAFNRKAE